MKCFWLSLNTSKEISCPSNGIWDGTRETRFWKISPFSLLVSNLPVYCTKKCAFIPQNYTLVIKKKKSFLYKQALFLGYKKFHSATEGVGCLAHPYARTPTEKKKGKKTTCTLIMQRLCLTNQEMYPFFCHILRSRAANSYYHLLSLNRLVLEVTSRQHALLKGKTPHTHLSL